MALPVSDFLAGEGKIFDVRSPGEFKKGHIPGAISFPLFSDEERAVVGTAYKKQGSVKALELGMGIVAPKLEGMAAQAKELVQGRSVKVYCWRGGLRSQSTASFLSSLGLRTRILKGGYKAFRNWVQRSFDEPKNLILLGGFTGSGKSRVLQCLQQKGVQVLDLEALASHRGSAFGSIGLAPQPTVEHFQNLLAMEWKELDSHQTLWVEDESRMVGKVPIPQGIYSQMLEAPVVILKRPLEERLEILEEDYAGYPQGKILQGVERLHKRLGGADTFQVKAWVEEGRYDLAAQRILQYYDKTYAHSLKRRKPRQLLEVYREKFNTEQWASELESLSRADITEACHA